MKSIIISICRHLPRVYQAVLASATLTDDVTSLKKLVLHNAVTLKLKDSDISVGQITHYKLYAEQDDKAALIYALLKLGLIKGKSIIFTNTVDKSYKLVLRFIYLILTSNRFVNRIKYLFYQLEVLPRILK